MNYDPVIRFRPIAEPRTFVTKWENEITNKTTRKKSISRDRDAKRGENFEDTYEYVYPQTDNDDYYNELAREENELCRKEAHEIEKTLRITDFIHEFDFEPTFTALTSEIENQRNEELIKELTYNDIMFYLYFKDKCLVHY
jgi:hypothetical protein